MGPPEFGAAGLEGPRPTWLMLSLPFGKKALNCLIQGHTADETHFNEDSGFKPLQILSAFVKKSFMSLLL